MFRFAGSLRASGFDGAAPAAAAAAALLIPLTGDIILGVWQSRDDWQPVMDALDVTEVAMEQVGRFCLRCSGGGCAL